MNEYFRDLRNLSKQIDGDTEKLEETWKTPHHMISGYGENIEEARPYVESLFESLKDIQDQLKNDQESRAKSITGIDEYLANVNIFYQDLKQQCEEVETVLSSEYGLEPLPESDACLSVNESETESSIITPEELENSITSYNVYSEAEGTSDTFLTLQSQPKSIATPVIKSRSSVMQSETLSRPNMT